MRLVGGRRCGLRSTLLLIVTLAALGATLGHAQVRIISDTVSIGSLSLDVGEQGTVDLRATDMTAPIGAWTVDISYDPSRVSIVDCAPEENSICDPQGMDDTIRVTGASATGLSTDTTLATITFQCQREGTSPLSTILRVWGSAIPEDPVVFPEISAGTISCEEASVAAATEKAGSTTAQELPSTTTPRASLPEAGMGGGPAAGIPLPVVALAAAGVGVLALFAAAIAGSLWTGRP